MIEKLPERMLADTDEVVSVLYVKIQKLIDKVNELELRVEKDKIDLGKWGV